jgi:acetyl esterase/lipase
MGGSRDVTFDHNGFFGQHPESEPADPHKLMADPLLVDPGKGGAGLDSVAGYQLRPESSYRGSGVPVADNGGRDYWGHPLYAGAPDRGAHERPAQEARRAWAMPPAPEGVTIEKDVAYLATGRVEKLDLYLPTGRPAGTRSPAVVILHGGGWTGGDKGASREFNIGTALAKAGYVAASVNYRLEAEGRWPTNLLDCKNAVRFLRANVERYGVDADRIGVIGGSAGGHLALMVGYTTGMAGLEPEAPYSGVSSAVRAVVDMYGPTNLLTRQATDKQGNPTGQVRLDSELLSTKATGDADGWRRASPVSHVRQDVPPTLILHGTADPTVDRDQSLELARALERAGAPHEILMLPGVGHTFDLQRWSGGPLPTDLRPVVLGFFDKHLRR